MAIKGTCNFCGKAFMKRRSDKRYCSRDCFKKGLAEMRLGSNNPKYVPPISRVCPTCGDTFTTKRKERIYCSRSCCNKSRTIASAKNLAERFWSNVAIGAPDECWEWKRHRNKNGYGTTSICHKPKAAHRVAFALYHGRQPSDNMVVMHTCDNPPCCNPNHLKEGTNADNSADMVAKGRSYSGPKSIAQRLKMRGENNNRAKLTEKEVIGIRERYARGDISQRALASEYKTTYNIVFRIVHRVTWKHLP